MTRDPELVTALQRSVVDTLRPILGTPRTVALLDFPNHANVGDSAIFLGELACLSSLGIRSPTYIADVATHDASEMRDRIGDGLILIAGGGGLNDVWPDALGFCLRIVETFPDNRIVWLPQSIHFSDAVALEATRRVLDGHPDLTLVLRDRRSREFARREFRAKLSLCPDMAFCLGRLPRPVEPILPTLYLLRTDREAAARSPAGYPPNLRTDWIDERPTALWLTNRLVGALAGRQPFRRGLRGALMATYAPLARQRLERGCRLLSSARRVVTDRLHGHILCLLLGIPHVLVDNSYGKLRSFYETWTADSPLVEGCEWESSGP